MSENVTQDQNGKRSFEDRVFARFDALDARLSALEEQAARRALETKPIWERALTEILELSTKMDQLERHMRVMREDIHGLRAEGLRFDERLTRLEEKPA